MRGSATRCHCESVGRSWHTTTSHRQYGESSDPTSTLRFTASLRAATSCCNVKCVVIARAFSVMLPLSRTFGSDYSLKRSHLHAEVTRECGSLIRIIERSVLAALRHTRATDPLPGFETADYWSRAMSHSEATGTSAPGMRQSPSLCAESAAASSASTSIVPCIGHEYHFFHS